MVGRKRGSGERKNRKQRKVFVAGNIVVMMVVVEVEKKRKGTDCDGGVIWEVLVILVAMVITVKKRMKKYNRLYVCSLSHELKNKGND
jgi:hypothetical protein